LVLDEKLDEYKRQVQISPLTIYIPDLYERIFNPDYVPETKETLEQEANLFQPQSPEDFDAMFEEWADLAGHINVEGLFDTPLTNDGTE
jgi:hypothetical protein